ncbi:MAG TPA: NAD-dependent deacylase [Bacteroidetes bacterium]|nr:NAD-dependent deacylase [Bacteroidota bacterium]
MKNIVILSGAGMSADSGLKTFRDHDGLWEGHDVMEVASPEGWESDRELVLDFYNQRRRNLLDAKPNAGHEALFRLEENYNVEIITQNVDDLHERAGSMNVHHLHGELLKVRSTGDPTLVYDWEDDLNNGDMCEKGYQLRPHIVWFGEAVPMIEKAAQITSKADILIIIGTSLAVYPAAGLIHYAQENIPKYLVDPKIPHGVQLNNIKFIQQTAQNGVPVLVEDILNEK